MITKTCGSCYINKPLESFRKNKNRPLGVQNMCRPCEKLKIPCRIDLVPIGIRRFCVACQEERDQVYFLYLKSKGHFEQVCRLCKREGKKVHNTLIKDNTKRCTKCLQYKIFSDFGVMSASRTGLSPSCKDCTRIRARDNYEKRKSKPGHKERKQREKEYYEKNKKKVSERGKLRRKNGDFKNPKFVKAIRDRRNKRLATDPIYKLISNTRTLIRSTFKNSICGLGGKGKQSMDILGCDGQTFLKHLESQFLPWMNLNNHGNCPSLEYNCTWQLDHIIPISLATDKETIHLLNHWSNFQPLCSRLNQWEKRNNVYPCSNIVLMITVDEDGKIEKVNTNK